jgi:hypothetical protein
LPRGDSQCSLKNALNVTRTQAHRHTQLCEPDRHILIEALFDEAADTRHEGCLRSRGCFTRPAPSAAPEPSTLGVVGLREERDVRALRVPRRARRPAVDPRGADGKDEGPVESPVPVENRLPLRPVGQLPPPDVRVDESSLQGPSESGRRNPGGLRVLADESLNAIAVAAGQGEGHSCSKHHVVLAVE